MQAKAASFEDVSQAFLGKPYKLDALGEGPGSYDGDPLYRTDAFDCTTFVETVWAMTEGADEAAWRSNLRAIRYRDGQVSFGNRLHFISLDWVPYQIKRGAMQDVSALIDAQLEKVTTLIDKRRWFEKRHWSQFEIFFKTAPYPRPTPVTVAFVPFDHYAADSRIDERLRDLLGHGALIVNFVRRNWDETFSLGTAIDITHQGILLLKDGVPTLRHASAVHGRVVDQGFWSYVKNRPQHSSLKGFQLLKPLDPSAGISSRLDHTNVPSP